MTDTQQPELTEDGRQRRTIKSFVMRAGRMTEGQQRGIDKGWPLFGLELEDGLRDFDQVFVAARRVPSRSASAWAIPLWRWLLQHPGRISSVSRCTSLASVRC